VTKNYLPLLHAIEEYKFNLGMWASIEIEAEEDKLYSREEALQLCSEAFELLKEEIEKLTRSGMLLIISKIDKKLAAHIMDFEYYLRSRSLKLKAAKKIEEIAEVFVDCKFLDELDKELTKLSIPELIREYQNIMRKGCE
jgi:hypothetical protein